MTKSLKLYAGSTNYFQFLCIRKTVTVSLRSQLSTH